MSHDLQTATNSWPAQDPGTYRRLPDSSRPIEPGDRRAPARGGVGAVHLVVGRLGHAQRAGQAVPAARRHQLVPALGPVPDLDRVGPGRLADRRRRQPAARPVHGLRRDARRPPQPGGRRARDPGAERDRHAVRHTVSAGDRDERAVPAPLPDRHGPLHQLRNRVADVRDPVRPRLHRPQGDRQGRGRLPRWVRRTPGLGQAGPGRDRSGRRTDPSGARSTSRPGPCTSSPTTTSTCCAGSSASTAARSRRW